MTSFLLMEGWHTALSRQTGEMLMKLRSMPKLRVDGLLERVKGRKSEKVKLMEEKEFALFQSMSFLADGLNQPPLHTSHPLRPFAQSLKNHLIKYKTGTQLEVKLFEALDNMVQFLDLVINFSEKEKLKHQERFTRNKFSEASDPKILKDIAPEFQYALRIENLNLYFRSLKKSADSLGPKKLQLINLLALIDATLLGSGAERVSAHLRLYNQTFTQADLQSSFYLIYNAEIEAVLNGFKAFPGLQKSHLKKFPSAARVYLLDTLELNSKSRCVFAWSDKNYSTFQDLDDTKVAGVDDICVARKQYFEEGSSIGKQFLDSYIAERRLKMNESEETRQNIRLGFFFLVATCFVDWYLCTI